MHNFVDLPNPYELDSAAKQQQALQLTTSSTNQQTHSQPQNNFLQQ